MRHTYPSDICRDQFEEIRPILESARKHTRPRTIDLYDVFCGILYILKSGCQWRMLPVEYPHAVPRSKNGEVATIISASGARRMMKKRIVLPIFNDL
jgi:transposase